VIEDPDIFRAAKLLIDRHGNPRGQAPQSARPFSRSFQRFYPAARGSLSRARVELSKEIFAEDG
jgi:hypothetical protein